MIVVREVNLYNFQLADLELFLAVAQCGNFTKAGEKMFVTQSWVSKRMNLLENESGLLLFIRNKRGVILTPAGRALEERLKNIMNDIRSAIHEAHTIQTGVSGSLRVGFLEWGTIMFMEQLGIFMEQNPQFSIEAYRQQFAELRDSIAADRSDLIFTMSYDCVQLPEDDYNILEVRQVPLVAYMHKSHPLADRKVLDMEDLQSESILMVNRESSSGYYDYICGLFQEKGLYPFITQYAHNGGAHIGNILLNKGILLASQYFLENSWEDRIARVPVRGGDIYVCAIWKIQNSNPVLIKFLQSILEHVRK